MIAADEHALTEGRLTDLEDGNLKYTTDYRRMYATLIGKWMGHADTEGVLRGKFDPLPLVGA